MQTTSDEVDAQTMWTPVEARVVWMSPDVDVALLKLPESIAVCESVQFGRLPNGNTGGHIDFSFYGWPECYRDRDKKPQEGGRDTIGEIFLADTVDKGLLTLRPKYYPKEDYTQKTDYKPESSPWTGVSGAAIICAGYIVAVQSQHQNLAEPESLKAAPLDLIYQNPDWIGLLSEHGISHQPHSILSGPKEAGSGWSRGADEKPGISAEQQMAKALQALNYTQQQGAFDQFLDSDRVIEAFMVEVTYDIEAELQKCLVSRLSRSLIGGNSPTFQIFGVNRNWRSDPMSELISRLAPALGLPRTAKTADIHECLLRLGRTQSVVMVLYGVPEMGSDGLVSLMREFWYPLIDRMANAPGHVGEGRILLFLAGDRPMKSLRELSQQLGPLNYPDALENITPTDIENWRQITEVRQLVNCRRPVVPDLTSRLRPICPKDNAYETLENVCEIFGFEGGLEQFEPFWKLSGDLVA